MPGYFFARHSACFTPKAPPLFFSSFLPCLRWSSSSLLAVRSPLHEASYGSGAGLSFLAAGMKHSIQSSWFCFPLGCKTEKLLRKQLFAAAGASVC